MAVSRANHFDFDALPAGVDLSAKLFFLAKINASGELVLAGAGDVVYGAITEGGDVGEPVTVQKNGLAKVVAGAAVTAGAEVMSDANGNAVAATGAGKAVFGIARNSTDGTALLEVEVARRSVPA